MTIPKVIRYWSRWGNLCLSMLLQRTILGKLSGINTQTVWGLYFTPSLSHPNNRNVYRFIYKTCTLAVHRKWYMNEYQWTVFVFIWHIDMYLPFCVSIFCCYHACIAWLYQNSLTPLAMYCECFPGQSWGVMTCGDYIKLSIVVIKYMKYIDMFIIIIIRIPVTQMFTNIAHFYFCLCGHSFFFYLSVIIEGHVMSSLHLHQIISTCECSK